LQEDYRSMNERGIVQETCRGKRASTTCTRLLQRWPAKSSVLPSRESRSLGRLTRRGPPKPLLAAPPYSLLLTLYCLAPDPLR
jgi:hypothetical protein